MKEYVWNDPRDNELPLAVITIDINGEKWNVPLEEWNKAVEENRTKVITSNNKLFFVTEEQYELIKEANNNIK
ncbi:MAG: hypothetical protein ACOVK2_02865 [Candidatus Fonsibacter sp.]